MAQPIAPDCGPQFLFPPALEDWAPRAPPARFLREFADQLDLKAGGVHRFAHNAQAVTDYFGGHAWSIPAFFAFLCGK
jgi:hypothetical protein